MGSSPSPRPGNKAEAPPKRGLAPSHRSAWGDNPSIPEPPRSGVQCSAPAAGVQLSPAVPSRGPFGASNPQRTRSSPASVLTAAGSTRARSTTTLVHEAVTRASARRRRTRTSAGELPCASSRADEVFPMVPKSVIASRDNDLARRSASVTCAATASALAANRAAQPSSPRAHHPH
jgi:hypothetical protein